MSRRRSFDHAKRDVLAALRAGAYQHEARRRIASKDLLLTGKVSAETVAAVVSRCTAANHTSSPHHFAHEVQVHVLRRERWYIKFYFLDPDTVFISVHQ